jgi:putative ABC transport system permease protein
LKLYNADIGIDTDHVLSFNLKWPDSKRLPPTEEGLFYDGLLADLDAIPGIESASLVRPLPSETAGPQPYEIDGEPNVRAGAGCVLIAPSYFHAVGTSILAGREFSSTDRTAARPVALVNERFASQYFPSQSAPALQ